MDFAKARKQEVLEELAADAASAHEQHSRLWRKTGNVSSVLEKRMIQSNRVLNRNQENTSLMRLARVPTERLR